MIDSVYAVSIGCAVDFAAGVSSVRLDGLATEVVSANLFGLFTGAWATRGVHKAYVRTAAARRFIALFSGFNYLEIRLSWCTELYQTREECEIISARRRLSNGRQQR